MTRPVVTALVYDKKGNLLSMGRNSYLKTHPVQAQAAKKVGQDSRIYLHAEIHAIVKLPDWSKAHRIVVTRLHADGTPACAAPCPVCMEVIKQTKIKRIEHT